MQAPNMNRGDNQMTIGNENKERGHWGKKLDFTLACLGYAVGLGNFCRFPYICMKNGGGAFLIPYFLCLFLCGIPLFFLELSIGQFSSLGPLSVWKMCPLFKGLGYTSAAASFVGSTYYNIVLAWTLYYLGHSFTSELPWANCNNSWNTPMCQVRGERVLQVKDMNTNMSFVYGAPNGTYRSETINIRLISNISNATTKTTPSEEFWQNQMLQLTSGIDEMGGMRWQLVLCLGAAWVLIFLCIFRGIRSTGKAVYVTVPLPYMLLTILLVRGCLLPGSLDGIKFYLIPEFEKLLNFDVWVEACVQVFFSLGPTWGCLISMASYNRFNNNCFFDAMLIPLLNCGTSLFSGFVIFSVLGFMAKEANLPVKDVVTSGPGLAFVVYPEALTKLPLAPMWSVLFFIMLLSLGLDSQFAMVEMIVSGLCDVFSTKLRHKKTTVTAILCIIQFSIGLVFTTRGGLYVFQLFDWYCAAVVSLLIGILECVVIGYIYGLKRFSFDVMLMIGSKSKIWWIWWKMCWLMLSPGLLTGIFVVTCVKFHAPFYGSYSYPGWAIGIGWVIALVSLFPIPLLMIKEIIKARGSLYERIRQLVVPEKDWGPALEHNQTKYKVRLQNGNAQYIVGSTHCQEENYMLKSTFV